MLIAPGAQLYRSWSPILDGPLEKTMTAKSFCCHHMTTLLVEFNTPILLSVGVKRLFSFVKEVIRPVQAVLSDAHFSKC